MQLRILIPSINNIVRRHLRITLLVLIATTFQTALAVEVDNDAAADLMDRAKQAMIEAQYNRAIKTYTQIVNMPDNAYRQDALELLGLAYERSGKFDKAKIEYERYLQLYPKVDGAERVKQRLAGVTTATWQAPKKLTETRKKASKSQWLVYGAFSQYVRRDVSKFENQPEVVNLYSLTTSLDTTVRRRSENGLDIKARVSGSNLYDLEGTLPNEQELSYLYVDINQRGQGWSASLGRQTAYGGGVLGRYDGLNLGKRFGDNFTVKLVAGMPVEKTTDINVNSSRRFYGINIDTGIWHKYWETKAYYIEQEADGLLDRQAVGGELRYLHPEINLYTLVDYDISYDSLNIFNTQGSWVVDDKTTYTYLIDYRNAPPITTTNALFGQPVATLNDLQQIYTEEEIEQLAEDRTPKSTLAMVGMSRRLNDTYRFDVDLSATKFSSTISSGGVAATAGTDVDYYLSTQLSARDLWLTRDVHIVGVRFAETDTYTSTTLFVNSRIPAGQQWDINPRLYLTQQDYTNNDSQQTVNPGLKINYRWTRRATFEFDTGYSISKREQWFGSQEYKSYYVDIGYRIDF